MSRLNSFFWYCSGATTSLLEKCSTEHSKYVGIGATVFFTGLFAALSSSFAFYTIFDNIFIASLLGLVWGLMIFNLDRFIVSSMRKSGSVKKELLMATPRIILAILISIVIVKPLELKIFDKEIQAELIVMEQQAIRNQESEAKSRFTSKSDQLKTEIEKFKKEIVDKAQKRDELVKIAQEEADGTGGSMKKNLGPIYKVKKADAEKTDLELQALITDNTNRIAALQKSLDGNEKDQAQALAGLGEISLSGPASRLEALDRLANSSTAIAWANFFIILLFIVIETSPVIVKVMSNKGPYDNLLKVEEHRTLAFEIEETAQINTATKQRSGTMHATEKEFVTNRLDAELLG